MSQAKELRLVMTVKDFERVRDFYRDLLGTNELEVWGSDGGKISLFELERATLEIIDEKQAEAIDQIEVGRRVSGAFRLAFAVPDSERAVQEAQRTGATLINPPVKTPWQSLNARVIDPEGVQITLFEESGERAV